VVEEEEEKQPAIKRRGHAMREKEINKVMDENSLQSDMNLSVLESFGPEDYSEGVKKSEPIVELQAEEDKQSQSSLKRNRTLGTEVNLPGVENLSDTRAKSRGCSVKMQSKIVTKPI